MIGGARLLVEGIGLLLRERRLWSLAAMPVLLALVFVGLAMALFWHWSADVFALVAGWLPLLEPREWYTWIWLGPAKLLFWLLGWALFLAAAALAAAVAFLLANVVAAPFLDALSRRVEEIVAGRAPEGEGSGLDAIWREGRFAAANEL